MKSKTSVCIVAILAVILLGQSAFAEAAKTKDTSQVIKKGRNLSIKLFESMTLDSGDKKPADKAQDKAITKKTTKKPEPKKVEPKKPTPKKPVPKKVEPKKVVKKPVKTVSKTKHDTVKNSISNVR